MSVLEKATRILDLVADAPDDATLTSIAQRLGQPRSSTHRMLTELVQLGLLMRVPSAGYVPGPRLVRWGEAAGGTSDLVRSSKAAMHRLRDLIGESVHLYVRQRDTRICVAAADGKYELRHFPEVGKPLPLSVGASGKLLLAFADEATLKQELRRVAAEPLAPRAPGAAQLVEQLEVIRRTGWAMSFGEREEGLAAGAAPIHNQAGAVNATLTVSGPTARLNRERLEAIRPRLSAAASEISRALGWLPDDASRPGAVPSTIPAAGVR